MKLSPCQRPWTAYLARLAREKPDKPVASYEVARDLDRPSGFS